MFFKISIPGTQCSEVFEIKCAHNEWHFASLKDQDTVFQSHQNLGSLISGFVASQKDNNNLVFSLSVGMNTQTVLVFKETSHPEDFFIENEEGLFFEAISSPVSKILSFSQMEDIHEACANVEKEKKRVRTSV
jgi:hypothetical protein